MELGTSFCQDCHDDVTVARIVSLLQIIKLDLLLLILITAVRALRIFLFQESAPR